jgi:hypothetical protein
MKDIQKIFVELFPKNACNISVTCKKVGIDRSTFYEWYNKTIIEKDENGKDIQKENEFKNAVDEAKEAMIDHTESALAKLISGMNTKITKIKEVISKTGEVVRLREEQTFINRPDTAAVIYFLKTKGKHRGWKEVAYTEENESAETKLSKSQKAAIEKLTAEEKKQLIELTKKVIDV